MSNDKRLIEDYLPIKAISAEASREKSVRKGHISTLHLWWARRPLVACRAAVYGALVPASQFVPENGPDNKKQSLGRANAAKFMKRLCRYPSDSKPEIKADTEKVIREAQGHILNAHTDRLTRELAETRASGNWPAWVEEFKWDKDKEQVTREDIEAGRAPRPRVLDMFAGGGAIPLEALRLGCEAYALDLNPVAHIIELCTLVYPQKYGKPDPNTRGMTGPKGPDGHPTWGGLAEEVRYWGNWVLDRVRKEIGDLYPPIPDPEVWDIPPEIAFDRETGQWNLTKPGKSKKGIKVEALTAATGKTAKMFDDEDDESEEPFCSAAQVPPGFLQPVAYLWTRTVTCKNPACGASVPLVKQTWLCKKDPRPATKKRPAVPGRYVALKMHAPRKARQVSFEVVESEKETGLGFNPAGFSKAGNATCPFCGTVADNDYVKAEGCAGRMANQSMAVVCTRRGRQGKVYLAAGELDGIPLLDDEAILGRIADLCRRTSLTMPDEPIEARMTGGICLPYGLTTFGHLFTPRQILSLLSFTAAVRETHATIVGNTDQAKAVVTLVACIVDKQADFNSSLCVLKPDGGRGIVHTFGRQAIPMVWDFAEANPFNEIIASWGSSSDEVLSNITDLQTLPCGRTTRGSATSLPYEDASLDAVVSDPPYYDNVDYAKLADFFYVWLKRSVGHLYPEHFAAPGTPKKQEAVADPVRYGGDRAKAIRAYEDMMAQSLAEAHRVLKRGGSLVVVYAHKTTLGWSTLVDAFRRANFTVTEAWPLDTETKGRLVARDTAALASSIFLVGHKRAPDSGTGNYEDEVQPELQQIVRERVETLWGQGITGADLVIACVGAGLRAFTKYERVEYANGEEMAAEKFLAEVEGVVLDVMLQQIAGKVGRGVSAVDPHSRFYVLWRSVYKAAAIEAGEAIVFTYGQHVELDGPKGLACGRSPLVEKKKSTYRLRDYTERGDDEKLGLPGDDGEPAPLVDALHRVLWLMEHRPPAAMTKFLQEAKVNRDQLRVLAQALSGPALKGGGLADVSGGSELAALTKLTSNWKSVVEDALSPLER